MQEWSRYTTAGTFGAERPIDHVELGPGEVDRLDRRLLGDVDGLRILDLGCGAGRSAVALARQGARVVALDPDDEEVSATRAAAEAAEVHVETHQADLADLAFLHADSFDAVLAVHSFAAVEDLGRVFRQTHRLLKSDRPIVLTLPHPASFEASAAGPFGTGAHLTYPHAISTVFTQLTRANYRVDTLLEPAGDAAHPASVVYRARKIGN